AVAEPATGRAVSDPSETFVWPKPRIMGASLSSGVSRSVYSYTIFHGRDNLSWKISWKRAAFMAVRAFLSMVHFRTEIISVRREAPDKACSDIKARRIPEKIRWP